MTEPENVTPLPKRRKDNAAPTEPGHVAEPTTEAPEGSSAQQRADRLRTKLVTGAALLNIPEPEPLVSGLLFYETTSMIVGAPKTGKTFLAIDLAGAVMTGRDWQGARSFPKSKRVFYLAGEGRRGVVRRFTAWANHHATMLGTTGPELLAEITRNLVMLPGGLELQKDDDRKAILDIIGEFGPDLVLVDTLARHFQGGEENSSRDVGKYVQAVEAIAQETGAHVSSVHHLGKNPTNGARGSSALLGAVDTELTVSGDTQKGLTVKVTAQKDEEAAPLWWVRFEKVETPTQSQPLATSLVALPAAQAPPPEGGTFVALMESLAALDDPKGVTESLWRGDYDDKQKNEKETVRGTFARWVKVLEHSGQIVNMNTTDKGANRWRPVSQKPEARPLDL
jgi:hypothetical protein